MKLQHVLLGAASLLLPPLAQAQAADDDFCDAACEAVFDDALAQESALWATANITQDPFYATPANASSGARPGDVLRWQEVPPAQLNANWSGIPAGFSYNRLLYVTEDIDGRPMPASAFVLLPFSAEAATAGGPGSSAPNGTAKAAFRTVVWTHGTAGYARQCAPSNHRQLYYGWGGPFFYAAAGYAVVAPDYAGQGSLVAGGFQYEAGYLHAADAAYALAAARRRLGPRVLSAEYVVVGHSEGGMTAWRTNQRLAEPNQTALAAAGGRFLGSVAVAPALRPRDLIPRSIELAAGGPLGDPVYLIFLRSLAHLYPAAFRPADILTDRALALMPRALDAGCLGVAGALFRNLTAADVFRSRAWLAAPELADWQARYNGDRNGALAAPLLVVQGLADALTYANNTRESFEKLCAAHGDTARAELYQLPDLGHGGALDASHAYVLAWVKARFEGAEAPRGCAVKTARPFTEKFQSDRPH